MATYISTYPSLNDRIMQQNKVSIDGDSYKLNFSYDVSEDDGTKKNMLEETNTNTLFYSLCDSQGI